MKEKLYDQHSDIALKAQGVIDYLREQQRGNGDAAVSALVAEYILAEMEVVKRLAVAADNLVCRTHDTDR